MSPQQIKAGLILKGITQRQIAQRLGVSDAAVSQVIYGVEKNRRIREAIAEALEQPVEQVWPSKIA